MSLISKLKAIFVRKAVGQKLDTSEVVSDLVGGGVVGTVVGEVVEEAAKVVKAERRKKK